MSSSRSIFESQRFRRAIIALYVLALAGVIGVYIGVSLLDVRTAVYVRGHDTLEKRRPNAMRGVVLNARTGKFRSGVTVTLYLVEPDSFDEARDPVEAPPDGRRIDEARPGRGRIVQTAVRVPREVDPGEYELVLRVEGPSIEPFEANRRIEVVDRQTGELEWPSKTSRLLAENRRERFSSDPVDDQEGSLAIDILPDDAEVPRGLPGEVFIRTYDAETGEPVPAVVNVDEVEATGQWGKAADIPSRFETDALGLRAIDLRAVGAQVWSLSAEERDFEAEEDGQKREGSAEVTVHTVPSQVSLTLDKQFLWGNGELSGQVQSLYRSGQLFVDIYRGDDWVKADSMPLRGRNGVLRTALPKIKSGDGWLYRLQLSRGLYDAGQGWVSDHIVRFESEEPSDVADAVERVVTHISEQTDDAYFDYLADADVLGNAHAGRQTYERWLRASLEAIPRHFARPEALFNSQESDRADLEAWKDDFQDDLMNVIAVALGAGLLVIAYIALVGYRRRREHQRDLERIDDEMAAEAASEERTDGEEVPVVETSRFDNFLAILLGLVALATFVMFAYGLLLVLSYL